MVNGESGLTGDHPNGRCSNVEWAGGSARYGMEIGVVLRGEREAKKRQ